MQNINDLFQAAETADDSPTFENSPLLTHEELPEGTEVLCEIVWTDTHVRDNGGVTFSNKLEVLEGDHTGGAFFDSLHLSGGTNGTLTPGQNAYNKRLFNKIKATGLDGAFFAASPSNEAIAKAMKGAKVVVKVRWQDEKDGRVWLDNTTTWTPATPAATSGYTPKGF